MNGSIGVESIVDQGSTFWFEVRATVADDSVQEVSIPVVSNAMVGALNERRILIVDDFAPNREVIEGYLTSWEIDYSSVASGTEALENLVQGQQDGKPYDLALIDFMMPGMNGGELASTIATRPDIPEIKLVMVTAAYKINDIPSDQAAGFDRCLLKPIFASELMDVLMELEDREFMTPTMLENTVQDLEVIIPLDGTVKVLVAEDSPVNQMVITRMLTRLDCQVEIVENGALLVEEYQNHAYDLIFMDCMMPEMDGYEATKAVRTYETTHQKNRIPIVAMTANALDTDRQQCLDAGMDDYIAKPARMEAICAVLEKYVRAPQPQ